MLGLVLLCATEGDSAATWFALASAPSGSSSTIQSSRVSSDVTETPDSAGVASACSSGSWVAALPGAAGEAEMRFVTSKPKALRYLH